MAKRVTTPSGRIFPTIAEAKAYYGLVRDGLAIGAKLAEPDRSDVIDIYRRYCIAQPWPGSVDHPVDIVAAWDNRQRPGDHYAQTKALAAVPHEGDPVVFSINKALEAVAQ